MIVIALTRCLYLVRHSLPWRRLVFEETPHISPGHTIRNSALLVDDAPSNKLPDGLFSTRYM
jgi:hypothetical protein